MNIRLKLCSLLAAGVVSLLTPPISRAELLVNENFEYNLGNLKGQGSWLAYGSNAAQTVDVVDGALTFPGYQDEAVGKAAKLTPIASGNDVFVPLGLRHTEGTLYASMMVNVTETAATSSTAAYMLCFVSSKNGLKDGGTGNEYCKVMIIKGDSNDTYKIGISRAQATPEVTSASLKFNEPVLLVVAYEIVEGTTNDKVYAWINPATNLKNAPAATISNVGSSSNSGDVNVAYGLEGFELRQGATPTKVGAGLTVDALRISQTWADLFPGGGSEEPVDKPAISVSSTGVDFGTMYQGTTVTKTINVKGSKLTGNIALASSSSAVTVSPAQVNLTDALSDAGAEVTLTYKAGAANLAAELTLTSEGADEVKVALTSTVVPVAEMNNIAMLNTVKNETFDLIRYTGSMAKVSYVDAAQKIVYVQDMMGATRLDYSMFDAAPYAAGDKIKNFIVYRADNFGPQFTIVDPGTVTSQGNTVAPTDATFADIASDYESYAYKLVTVTDVTVTETGKTWGTGAAASQTVNGKVTTGRVRTFAGTDIAAAEIPGFITSMTGILTSASNVILTARSSADIVSEEAKLEVSHELKIDAAQYQKINQKVDYAVFTVKATALTKPVSLWIGGKNSAMFSLSREEIPAGTGLYQVTVYYTPTATGVHEARINFDATPTELSVGYSLRAKAYDPANPPMLTVNTAGLTDFTAIPGGSQEQTVSYTVANGLEYGTIKVGDGSGFLLGTSSIMKEGTYDLKITFRPQAEGDYTQTITLSTPMAEDVTFTVKGKCAGTVPPEQTEGDELAFDGPALKQYSTDFSSATADNKPLKLEGWKNVAYEGTRAWWSTTIDGNQAAKVVAYDSKAAESTPCTMMLMSPRLDFTDATERLLCFNVMGRMMTEGMADRFMVGLIDAKAADADPSNVKVEGIEGLGLPCTAEENDTWARYVLDCHKWDMPEEFYIAFVFSSQRGKESSVQYFIDDFSWGRTDMPFIRSSHQMLEHYASAGASTTETISIEGRNLKEPIKLSLAGSDAGCFALSTTSLPVEGGTFTLDFNSAEQREHTAIVTLLSGSDARADIMVVANTDPAGIGSITVDGADWGDRVSVYDLEGRTLMSDAPVADALEMMRAAAGRLFIVRAADGTAYKYIAK